MGDQFYERPFQPRLWGDPEGNVQAPPEVIRVKASPADMSDWVWPNQVAPPPKRQYEAAVRRYTQYLKLLGVWETMPEESHQRTPSRVTDALLELFGDNLEPINFTVFPNPCLEKDGLVVVQDVDFNSLCAHHLLPYFGKCHVGYIPDEWVVGLSKIPRVIEHATHGCSIQEEVVELVADFLDAGLRPDGVIVVMEAQHSCMCARGVRKPGSIVKTVAVRGAFRDIAEQERFMRLVAL